MGSWADEMKEGMAGGGAQCRIHPRAVLSAAAWRDDRCKGSMEKESSHLRNREASRRDDTGPGLTVRGPSCHRHGAQEEGVPRNSLLLDEGPVLPDDDKPLPRRKVEQWDLCFSVTVGQQLRVCVGRSREPRQEHLLVLMFLQHAEQERRAEIAATGGGVW